MAINPLYMNELEMIESLEDFNEEVKQRFQVTDLSSLNWTLRKLAVIEEKKKETNEMIDAEIERLNAFRKKELDKQQGAEDFFKILISEFAIHKRDEDPGFKSQKTPYGTIGFRKQQPKWNYDDEKLVNHLEATEYNHLVRTKKEPIKTEIKKLFTIREDGRVLDDAGCFVDGITIEFLPDVLDIKPLEV